MNNSSSGGNTDKVSQFYNCKEIICFFSEFVTLNSYYLSKIYTHLKRTLNPIILQLQLKLNVILIQFIFYFTCCLGISYILYFISLLFRNQFSRSKYFDLIAKRILVVTAHPDDECMFFGPLILRMVNRDKCIYLLCLCNGDAEGKGHLRKKELWLSCGVLGMKAENIFLCNSSLRVDGPRMWKSENIAMLIRSYVEIFDIDTVVTFDKYGVSGHDNHISVFNAVSFLNLEKLLPVNCHIFLLESLGLVRKYSSMMDCAVTLLLSKNVFILLPYEQNQVKQAMDMHKTQLVWFRRLYMMFSRYTYVNSLCELPRYTG